jgi:hypothetical protein
MMPGILKGNEVAGIKAQQAFLRVALPQYFPSPCQFRYEPYASHTPPFGSFLFLLWAYNRESLHYCQMPISHLMIFPKTDINPMK